MLRCEQHESSDEKMKYVVQIIASLKSKHTLNCAASCYFLFLHTSEQSVTGTW